MEVVAAPVLHNKAPVKLPAVNTEFPQLSATDTVGAEGIVLGAAVPEARELVHPLAVVCDTVNIVEVSTVIEVVVSVVDHNNDPVKLLAVNTELPQLFETVTVGAVGIIFGAAVPLPAGPVHPFTCCVTVRVPAEATVMEAVVSPVLHTKVPV